MLEPVERTKCRKGSALSRSEEKSANVSTCPQKKPDHCLSLSASFPRVRAGEQVALAISTSGTVDCTPRSIHERTEKRGKSDRSARIIKRLRVQERGCCVSNKSARFKILEENSNTLSEWIPREFWKLWKKNLNGIRLAITAKWNEILRTKDTTSK